MTQEKEFAGCLIEISSMILNIISASRVALYFSVIDTWREIIIAIVLAFISIMTIVFVFNVFLPGKI